MNKRGSLPLLILHFLSQGPCHGYQLARQISQESQGVLDFKEGILYPVLHTMEEEGLVEAYSQEENGRLRRYYRLTRAGQSALASESKEWDEYTAAVRKILATGAAS